MTSCPVVHRSKLCQQDGTMEFTFDEEQNMDSLTMSAAYSTAEILQKAGLNTILGMGTTFRCFDLSFIHHLASEFIPVLEKKFQKNKTAEPAKAPAPNQLRHRWRKMFQMIQNLPQ